jgi:hypothetical protein
MSKALFLSTFLMVTSTSPTLDITTNLPAQQQTVPGSPGKGQRERSLKEIFGALDQKAKSLKARMDNDPKMAPGVILAKMVSVHSGQALIFLNGKLGPITFLLVYDGDKNEWEPADYFVPAIAPK